MNRSTAFVALAGAVVLLAGCSAKSGTATPTSVTSASAPGSTVSAVSTVSSAPESTTAESSPQSSGTGESSGADSSTAESTTEASGTAESGTAESGTAESGTAESGTAESGTAQSSSDESTTQDSSTRESTATAAPSVLDSQSVRWLTTYCTTVLPINTLQTYEKQITAAKKDLVKVKVPLVKEFETAGSVLTSTASRLKGVPAPTLTKVGSDLPRLLGGFATLGATLTAEGKKLAAIDPTKGRTAFVTAVQQYAPDLQRVPTVLGTGAGLKIPFAALTEIKRIPSCAKVITVA